MHNFSRGKKLAYENWATFVIFKTRPKTDNCPMCENSTNLITLYFLCPALQTDEHGQFHRSRVSRDGSGPSPTGHVFWVKPLGLTFTYIASKALAQAPFY
jgi:hypothetical protein